MSGDVGAEVAAVLAELGFCTFVEDINDASMCLCGLPALDHEERVEQIARAAHPAIFALIGRVEAAKAEAQELADAYRERYFEVCDQLRDANDAHDALGAKLASIKAHPPLKCECRGGPHGGYTCEGCSA